MKKICFVAINLCWLFIGCLSTPEPEQKQAMSVTGAMINIKEVDIYSEEGQNYQTMGFTDLQQANLKDEKNSNISYLPKGLDFLITENFVDPSTICTHAGSFDEETFFETEIFTVCILEGKTLFAIFSALTDKEPLLTDTVIELVVESGEDAYYSKPTYNVLNTVRQINIRSGEVGTVIQIDEEFYQSIITEKCSDVFLGAQELTKKEFTDFMQGYADYIFPKITKEKAIKEAEEAKQAAIIMNYMLGLPANSFLTTPPYALGFDEIGLSGDEKTNKSLYFQDDLYEQSLTVTESFIPEYNKDAKWIYKMSDNFLSLGFLISEHIISLNKRLSTKINIILNDHDEIVYFEQEFDKPEDLDNIPESTDEVIVETVKRGSKFSHVIYIRKDFAQEIETW